MDLFILRQDLQDAEAISRQLDAHLRLTTDAYLAKAGEGVALDEFLVWQSMVAAETSKLAAARHGIRNRMNCAKPCKIAVSSIVWLNVCANNVI